MITRYGIKVINPIDGSIVYYNGCLAPVLPLFSAQEAKVMSFRSAAAIAERLRLYYPIVKIFGTIYQSLDSIAVN